MSKGAVAEASRTTFKLQVALPRKVTKNNENVPVGPCSADPEKNIEYRFH